MKKMYFLLILLITVNGAWAQLYESFNYTAGQNVGGSCNPAPCSNNNWTTHFTQATGTIDVLSGSLSYTGLQASSGNRIKIPGNNTTTSRAINTPTSIASGPQIAYYSFLIKILDNTQLSTGYNTENYFISFGNSAGNTVSQVYGRVAASSVNAGANFRLGVYNGAGGGTPTYSEIATDLNFGTTYLVVVKYEITAVGPDIATLWVNPASLGGTEPGGGISNSSVDGGSPVTTFASVVINNNAASPNAEIDEIRAGLTWASVTPPISNNANLSNLTISAGTLTPAFASGTISYTASVANSVTSVDVTPTASNVNATITVNGTTTASGTARNVALSVGSNTITTVVTAQDGTTKTYTITITRAAALSSDANLSNLTISAGTLTPSFASGTTAYTASVANSVTSVDVTPTASSANATITVNGTPTTSGTARNVALNVGSNTITTVVTAQDGTTKTYTITITRAAAALAPTATTTAATSVTTTGATLNGTVNDNGATTTVSFEYGTSPTLAGATTIAATTGATVNAGSGNTSVSVTLSGLTPGTTYYYRVKGTNSAGTTSGNILNFTTAAANDTDVYCDKESKDKKVYVCHNGNTICVNLNALLSHLKHGDKLGKCTITGTITKTTMQDSKVPETFSKTLESSILNLEAFKVITTANPTSADFRIKVESSSNEMINIRVLDAVGRVMANMNGVHENSFQSFGRNYKAGNYFVEVVQGINRKTIKLVKL